MKKFTIFMWACLMSAAAGFASTTDNPGITCGDFSSYVDSKNTGPKGAFMLQGGSQEQAAQTYFYSGTGNLDKVRVYGTKPGLIFWNLSFVLKIYNVDINNRPSSLIQLK